MCRSEETSHFALISVRILTCTPSMRFRYLDIIFDNSSYSFHFKGCFFRAKHRFHFLRESDPLSLFCINRLRTAKILCVVLILQRLLTHSFCTMHVPSREACINSRRHLFKFRYPYTISFSVLYPKTKE